MQREHTNEWDRVQAADLAFSSRQALLRIRYNQRARDAHAAGVRTFDEVAASGPAPGTIETTHIYERAQAAFEEALRAEPSMYEAHTYLGYVHRKLGRFDASLKSYERALKIKPDYVFAIEYQGEAFLGLGDIQRARFNYLRLYALDRELAAKLLKAIESAEP